MSMSSVSDSDPDPGGYVWRKTDTRGADSLNEATAALVERMAHGIE